MQIKEGYSSVEMVLNDVKYEEFAWEVIGDLKMMTFFMDLQVGFTKFTMLSLPLG